MSFLSSRRAWHIMTQLALGVTLFFTLSGFLLYRPFAAAMLRGTERPKTRAYARNRFLRIVPAYWVVLFVVSLLGVALIRPGPFEITESRLGSGLLARDALLVQGYDRDTVLTGIGPAWSLAVEVVFYALLPVLALVGFRLARGAPGGGRRRLAAIVPPLVLLAVGLTGKAIAAFWVRGLGPGGAWVGDWHTVVYRSFLGQADLFTFGMLLAVLQVEIADGRLTMPRRWKPVTVVLAGVLALVTAAVTVKGLMSEYQYDTLMALAMGLLLALVILPGVNGQRGWHVRLLETRPFVAIGLVSYSLFLWHEPMLRWLRIHNVFLTPSWALPVNVAIGAAVSVALAALTYRFVELPALRRKRPMKPQQAPVSEAPPPTAAIQVPAPTEPLPAET